MDLMNAIAGIPGIGPLMPYIVALVAFAAFVARFIPPPAADANWVWITVYRMVNAIGQNGGHAQNATDPKGQ
jgi:hypothetical protein